MLTVCIPIYNYDCRELINNLHEQGLQLTVPFEILAINDGSAEEYKELYKNFYFESFRYIELRQNIGRARIRNLLAKEAKFNNLLFLDCDVKIISDDYLKKYIEQISEKSEVICGGTIYSTDFPGRDKSLHWQYALIKQKELSKAKEENPYRSFMTNNFLIRKQVFENIFFNEKLTQYGHEDTLFGIALEQQGKRIAHINNPVLHIDLDNNETFLRKTQQSILNLIQILNSTEDTDGFIRHVTLLQFYFKVKRKGLLPFLKTIDKAFEKRFYSFLLNGKGNIRLLNFYKLLFLIHHFSSKK